ncbi:PilZ domain-containing protein [uncultured Enterovirga sp.]|uniref:PilZ domain-containing protein n=1 Tax=uncultured Enterovirga sp. TaxID=2026352 RepID=UPI0035CA0958
MEEHRRAQRHRTLKGAHIVFNGGASTIDCMVRDLSETGARLKIASPVGIPDQFMLSLDSGEPHQCRVVWRRAKEIGVTFVLSSGNPPTIAE